MILNRSDQSKKIIYRCGTIHVTGYSYLYIDMCMKGNCEAPCEHMHMYYCTYNAITEWL